jgi:WS/DGAT/MGAT family acyltransferase
MADATAPPRPPREQRFERRMSDAEALMWNVEKDPWLNPSGGSLILLDRPLDVEHFRGQLAATVAHVPRLRERVVPGFARFSPPVWRPDPEFDLDYHIRRVALPAPGDERQLLDLVADIYQDPYDRTRPLWMFHMVEGLRGGGAALIWKIHHTVADGTGAGRLAEAFLQPTDRPPDPPTVDLPAVVAAAVERDGGGTEGAGGLVESVRDTVAHTARRQVGIVRRTMGEVAMWGADPLRARDAAGGILQAVRQVGGQISLPGRRGSDDEEGIPGGSPLWRSRSRHRQLELLSFPLDEALAAGKALGGSLNDWFVTGVVNGAVRYHDDRGVPLRTLNTSFVVSTRQDRAIGGNSFSPTRFSAPAGPMGPDERFRVLSRAMRERREGMTGGGALSGLAGVANLLPTSLVTSLARSQAAGMDFATSNLRGAKVQLYISGAAVTGNHPFGPLAGTAFNLTAMSYNGRLDMGLFVDPVAVRDPTELRDDLAAAYRELNEVAGITG